MTGSISLVMITLALLAGQPACGSEVNVEVAVLAQGAKFIGDGTGGAEVELWVGDQKLASGLTSGSTGATDQIMNATVSAMDASLDGDSHARASLRIDIDRPTLVRIVARGPMGFPDQVRETHMDLTIFPDHDYTGSQAIIASLAGVLIIPQEDKTHEHVFQLQMLCGCPITPGGLWNADDYRVTLHAVDGCEKHHVVEASHVGPGPRYAVDTSGLPPIREGRLDAVSNVHPQLAGSVIIHKDSNAICPD